MHGTAPPLDQHELRVFSIMYSTISYNLAIDMPSCALPMLLTSKCVLVQVDLQTYKMNARKFLCAARQ